MSPRWGSALGAHDGRTEESLELAVAGFTARFGGEPAVMASAPGRVELLGNHTDYNGGLVIAAAVDRRTAFVGRCTAGREARVASIQFNELDRFSLDDIQPTEPGAWTRYIRGVCWALTGWRGPLTCGFDAVVAGDVPLGAGLSSSASLQAACAMFLIELGAVRGRSARSLRWTRGMGSDWNWLGCSGDRRMSSWVWARVCSISFRVCLEVKAAHFSLIAERSNSTGCLLETLARPLLCAIPEPRAGWRTGCTIAGGGVRGGGERVSGFASSRWRRWPAFTSLPEAARVEVGSTRPCRARAAPPRLKRE